MAKKSYSKRSASDKKEQVQQLMNLLEEGVQNFEYEPEKYKALLKMQSLMPNYSFNNILLIMAQMKSATFVASFNSWKFLERNVIKGEKSIRILAPRFKKGKNEVTGRDESKLIGFIGVPVFDVSQTEGKPLPIDEFKLELEGETDEAIRIFQWTKILAEEDDCPIHIQFANGSNGYYRPSTHEIVIDPSLSTNHRAKTAVHELVHSRVHRHSHEGTTAEELESVAEGVAFIVCSHFGLDTSDYSFEYIRGWSSENGLSLLKYGEIIQKEACQLIDAYEEIATAITSTEPIEVKEKGVFNDASIVFASSCRVPKSEQQSHLHYYDVRHDDENGFRPVSVERIVRVNHIATIATDSPLDLGNDGRLELNDEDSDIVALAI